jgi:hypothetical protein
MNIPGFMRASKSSGISAREIAGPLKFLGNAWSAMKLLPRPEKFKPLMRRKPILLA